MHIGPTDPTPIPGEIPKKNPTDLTKKRKLPTPSAPEEPKDREPLSKKVKLEKEAFNKSSGIGQQGLFKSKGKEKEKEKEKEALDKSSGIEQQGLFESKGKEKEKEKEVDENTVVRQLNLGELGNVNLTKQQEDILISSSNFFSMIFSQGLTAHEPEVYLNLTGEEQVPISDKILKLINLAIHQKPYLEYSSFAEYEMKLKEQGDNSNANEVFDDFISMREAAIYLGMNSYIQEANKFCLEIISNNPNQDQKIKQLTQLISYGEFTQQEYGSIYKLSLEWDDLMTILTLPSGFKSEDIHSIQKFLEESAKLNPAIRHTLDYTLVYPTMETQITQMVQLCPNVKQLVVVSPNFDDEGNPPLFDINLSLTCNLEVLNIEKLYLDFPFEEAYRPANLIKLFPRLQELHVVDPMRDLEKVIIRRETYNNFASLQKIFLYEDLDTKPLDVYERSSETKRFVDTNPNAKSNETDDSESSESSESEREDTKRKK